jgi:hypothetical protein
MIDDVPFEIGGPLPAEAARWGVVANAANAFARSMAEPPPPATITASVESSSASPANPAATWATVGSPSETAMIREPMPAAASIDSIVSLVAEASRLRLPPTSQTRRPTMATSSAISASLPLPNRTIGGRASSYGGISTVIGAPR